MASGVSSNASAILSKARCREVIPLFPVRIFRISARERGEICRLKEESSKTPQHSFCVYRCDGAAVPNPQINIADHSAQLTRAPDTDERPDQITTSFHRRSAPPSRIDTVKRTHTDLRNSNDSQILVTLLFRQTKPPHFSISNIVPAM